MRAMAKWLLLLFAVTLAVWVFGPREPAPLAIRSPDLAPNVDLDAYLAVREGRFSDIVPGTEKQIIWAGAPNIQTDLSIVYIHGFSASAMELRPVPDRVAAALGANLYFTRLRGHGRGPMAMQHGSVESWMADLGEARDIGLRLGRRTIVMATSTGGTLAAAAARDGAAMRHVAGIVFVAPNFGLTNRAAGLLTWPFARDWAPLVVGAMRDSKPRNALHAKFWTTRYPTTALLPMAALVAAVDRVDFTGVKTPALFYFSPDDAVVDAMQTTKILKRWGGPVRVVQPRLTAEDDPLAHLIAGDIVSPGQTDFAVRQMLYWIRQL